MISCYMLKYVKVGNEIVGARPVGWDKQDVDGFGHDSEGNDVCATEWHTTCPMCGILIHFKLNNIYVLEEKEEEEEEEENVECEECGASKMPEGVIKRDKKEKEIKEEIKEKGCFQDPIKAGLFKKKLLR